MSRCCKVGKLRRGTRNTSYPGYGCPVIKRLSHWASIRLRSRNSQNSQTVTHNKNGKAIEKHSFLIFFLQAGPTYLFGGKGVRTKSKKISKYLP